MRNMIELAKKRAEGLITVWKGKRKLALLEDLFAFSSFLISRSDTSRSAPEILYKRKIIGILSRAEFLSGIYRCSSFESYPSYRQLGQIYLLFLPGVSSLFVVARLGALFVPQFRKLIALALLRN